MNNPEFHECCVCGFRWKHGKSGHHICSISMKETIDNLETTLKLGVELLDSILPQIGKLCLDIGKLNTFFIAARPLIKDESNDTKTETTNR